MLGQYTLCVKSVQFYQQFCYLAKHLSTRRPAATLAQAIDEPQQREHVNSGGPGEDDVDAPDQEQTNRKKPPSAYLIGHHPTDELADGVGHGLATGDQACRKTKRLQLSQIQGFNVLLLPWLSFLHCWKKI